MKWFEEKPSWIPEKVFDKIKNEGCHLVAKSSDQGNENLTDEWRISFSLAELALPETLSEFQKKCYLVVKIIFYKHFKSLKDKKTERHLSSYLLKTIKFKLQDQSQTLEYEKNIDSWRSKI